MHRRPPDANEHPGLCDPAVELCRGHKPDVCNVAGEELRERVVVDARQELNARGGGSGFEEIRGVGVLTTVEVSGIFRIDVGLMRAEMVRDE
jgi:hypothetical protein